MQVPVSDGCIKKVRKPANVASTPAQADRPVGLTVAEQAILQWVIKGKSNKEIARLLGRSEGTIKIHMQNLFRKTGTANRRQLMFNAYLRWTP